MNCFFCQSELDHNNQFCNAEPCRFYQVRHLYEGTNLLKVEFVGTFRGHYIMVQYAVMENQRFQRLPECVVLERDQISYKKEIISIPYPPITLTPTNFKSKLKTYLIFS